MKFLEYTIKELYCQYGNSMQDLTLVLPTRRAGLFAKDWLGRLIGNSPVFAPECTTISDLFDSLCPLKAAEELKTVCLLYNIYKAHVETNLSLDAFYGWGRQLIADFNNADKCADGITAEGILRNTMEARHFDESNIDKEVRERIVHLFRQSGVSVPDSEKSVRKDYEALWRKIPDIYSDLTKALLKEGSALEGTRWRWVADHIDQWAPQFEGRKLVFVGFNQLLSVERALMIRLKERGVALFYWDYDADFDSHEGNNIRAYRNVRRNMRHDGTLVENLGGRYDDSVEGVREPIEVIAAPSDNAQARYVHHWLQAHHREGDRTAIVVCSETQLEHVVFAIPPQFAERVNITKGFPLRNTRIYADIARHLHSQKKEEADFAEVLQGLLRQIDSHVPGVESQESSALPWHELLGVESLWQARLVVVRFLQLVKDGTLDHIRQIHTLRNLLLRHLGTVSIPFHGEPITDIQVIGVLETRALDFDNILFLNVEEGVLPKVGKDKSFIPYYLRKTYGLPTNDEQTDIYAYNYFRLLRRANHVTVLYSDAQTAMGQKGMSRFVMQMLVSRRFEIRRRLLTEGSTLPVDITDEQASQLIRQMADSKSYADRLKQMQSQGREASLSPSAIKTYLTCPMKFFVRYMLSVAEPEKPDAMLQTNELGTLIHNSAQAAYDIITDNGHRPLTSGAIRQFRNDKSQMARAVSKAFSMLNDDYRLRHDPNAPDYYLPAKHKVEANVAMKHLDNILDNDEHTPGLQIIDCEKKAYYEANLCGLSIKIGGSIDRIDRIADGSYRIADYKTGRYKDDNMKASSLESLFEVGQSKTGNILQTLIYCLAARHDKDVQRLLPRDAKVYPILLYTQKKLARFNPHLKLGKEPLMDFDAICGEFEQQLLALVKQILTTDNFPMAQQGSSSPCQYCKYQLLCGRKGRVV